MIRNTGYNFQDIKHQVDAAQHMQDAGKSEVAKKILEDMAKEILEGEKS